MYQCCENNVRWESWEDTCLGWRWRKRVLFWDLEWKQWLKERTLEIIKKLSQGTWNMRYEKVRGRKSQPKSKIGIWNQRIDWVGIEWWERTEVKSGPWSWLDSTIVSPVLVEQARRENKNLGSLFWLWSYHCKKTPSRTGRLGLGGESERPCFTLYIQLAHVICFGKNERNENYKEWFQLWILGWRYLSNLCICVWMYADILIYEWVK